MNELRSCSDESPTACKDESCTSLVVAQGKGGVVKDGRSFLSPNASYSRDVPSWHSQHREGRRRLGTHGPAIRADVNDATATSAAMQHIDEQRRAGVAVAKRAWRL
jgi:hypothetical protein